ncbi:DUF3575 domain-containing protein [Brumimicrobium oceani]|uniref:DUF3575 domain-containing protein n=1 Tax=Brumimicrobium oceani TaxID=2100725 RepID=A0A2U2X0S1_9FLAO|nr:DUF3575 domain-containing protein [Brumimicrobium oceani]PWH81387.1 hypothetical protein DIT68_15275 [Brumimicrobium oceani]
MKLIKSTLLLLLIFVANSTPLLAQPRVVTFGDEVEESEQRTYDEKNIIKLNLGELFSSDFSLYYERQLTNKLTFEVGAGLTYNDFFGHLFSPSLYAPEAYAVDKKMGNSFAVGLRFYTSRTFDGFYIAPEYKYRKYHWSDEAQFIDTDANIPGLYLDESRVHSIARLSFGYALFYSNNIQFDFQTGIGLSSITEKIYNPYSGELETTKVNFRPRVNLGFKLGYAF